MARSYRRDANGRFAGGGSDGGKRGGSAPARPTSPRKPRGLVTQRQAVAKGRQRLAAKQADPAASSRSRAAQKGALTKAQNKLAAAKQSGRRRLQPAAQAGVLRPGRGGAKPAATVAAANSIKPLRRREQRLAPAGLKANAIRSYSPRTIRGRVDASVRQTIAKARGPKPTYRVGLPPSKLTLPELNLKIARTTAREIADRNRRDVKGQVARFMLKDGRTNQDLRNARTLITRRAQRAAAAAARGSKPAARAQAIYDDQLAPRLPKGKGKGRNNLRPGPRNTKGAPPKKRKPRKPKG